MYSQSPGMRPASPSLRRRLPVPAIACVLMLGDIDVLLSNYYQSPLHRRVWLKLVTGLVNAKMACG